jgi:hypothetical protein
LAAGLEPLTLRRVYVLPVPAAWADSNPRPCNDEASVLPPSYYRLRFKKPFCGFKPNVRGCVENHSKERKDEMERKKDDKTREKRVFFDYF